jgi:asparagine synthase (glutamine-hydrolysing)
MSAICGMTGNYARRADAERALGSMLEPLTVRAPDDASIWRDPDGAALFGFRWLKTQPGEQTPGILHSGEGLAMTCDGHVFDDKSQGVSELLARFASKGADGWRGLDAQFALAIWDRKQAKLSLARDPLGVRFLYYFTSPDGVIFSSELKSLLQHPGVPRRYDEVGLAHYLTFLNVPGPRTLFDGIRRVTAGSVVEITANGKVDERRFWDLLDAPVDERNDEAYYVDKTRHLHEEAVRRRGVSGPMGALLSGGNDSSANVSMLARQGHEPLHTFTVGLAEFEGDTKYNDLHYARQVAELAGTKHHEALLSTDDFLKILPQTIDAQDDLVSEPSSVFLFHALRMARDEGVRVVVTGEANDELCCGHGGMVEIRDGHDKRWSKLMRLPAPARRAAALLAPVISPKRTDVLRRAAAGGEYFWSYEIAWPQVDLPDIVSADFFRHTSGRPASDVVLRNRQRVDASAHGKRDYLNHMVYAMMQDNYFGNLMLSKLDLLSAKLGLESRCPYTSPEYAHWVYNVPASLKFKDGWVKYFFKKSIEGVLPNDIIYRPKQGFRTPVQELFAGRLADWARPILLETGFTKAGILRREHLADLLERHKRRERDYSTKLWTAMVLNMWHDRWLT